jgi:hypothetical protein
MQPLTERRRQRFIPEPGRVYRTGELKQWTQNPTRMARRLVDQGVLKPLAQGLYAAPRQTPFGEAPPTDEAILDAFLDHTRYVFTGPERWNALGLGSTALFPRQLVYNTRRSGEFELGGRSFLLRRVKFPRRATPEWFVVDLIEHRDMVGLDAEQLQRRLRSALAAGRFDLERIRRAAEEYGTHATRRIVEQALAGAAG